MHKIGVNHTCLALMKKGMYLYQGWPPYPLLPPTPNPLPHTSCKQ